VATVTLFAFGQMRDMADTATPSNIPEKPPSEPKASILLVDDHLSFTSL
jgi:hypothetical protein